MNQQRQDLIIHKRVRRIADDYGCTIAEVHAVLDHHPIEIDRDKYLKRTLALELLRLDELEEAFATRLSWTAMLRQGRSWSGLPSAARRF